ncbi:MAG: hypothetical protein DI563_17925 [Variovorax paradoxus]|uniref:SnoaL-like domain-containing protein n=1 Tax=Variovorax paradoxus TaxID=34073 RepID=A0A2W5Q1K5_VARPD|nr:MAG: hypothetical protein DI563_17925 [Variovorax paradoxus]
MKQVRVCRGARVKHFHQDVLLYGEWIEATAEAAGMPHPERWASTQTLVLEADGQWRIASHQVHHVRREVGAIA